MKIRRKTLRMKQLFVLSIIFLLVVSTMIPTKGFLHAEALEEQNIEEPIVTKDIEGKRSYEIELGIDFEYNVNVEIPENVSEYTSMEIIDEIDENLSIQEAMFLVDGVNDSALEVDIEGQQVSSTLDVDQIDKLSGKELSLKITTQIREETTSKEEIENIAVVIINDDVVIKTDPVNVSVSIGESDASEEEAEDSTVEEESEVSEEKNTEPSDVPVNGDELEKKETKSEDISGEEEKSNIQVLDEDGITMNDVDFYASYNNWMYQYEGDSELLENNNGETWEKGRLQANIELENSNGLAKSSNALYINANGTGLYKIEENGNTTKVGDLFSNTAAAGFSNDDSTYTYVYRGSNGEVRIATFNVDTKATTDNQIMNVTEDKNYEHASNGDLVIDQEGYVWHITFNNVGGDPSSRLARINPNTGELDRIIPVRNSNGDVMGSSGSLAFLENGNLVGLIGDERPVDIVVINPDNGIVEQSIASGTPWFNDFASSAYPLLKPELSIMKSVNPEGEVFLGEELTYTLEVSNTGNIASTNTSVKDSLPEGTTYVSGSTKLNGEDVSDIDNQSPLFEGMIVNSPGTDDGVLFAGEDNNAVITFKVKVDDGAKAGDEIINVASASSAEIEEFESNEVKNKIIYKDPELESTKSAELEDKADGNTDADNPEVGDTIRYTITTKNTIADSIIENLVISDEIPEGVTYVDGSLEVDGESVTDGEDDDAGHSVDGQVIGTFGDVTDTDEHSITFLVTIDEGQAGNDIKNIAVVESDNTDPEDPEDEVTVYPREPILDGKKSAVNKETGKDNFEVGDTVIYTIEGRNTVSDSLVKDLVITDELPAGLEFVEGSLEASHDGEATFTDGVITAMFGDVEDTEWRTVTFEAEIQSDQADETIENVATVEGRDTPPTYPGTEIVVDYKDPSLDSSKSAELEAKADGNTDTDNLEVGDTIRYTITTQNTIEYSLVENLVIMDDIPEGVTYVDESLEVDGSSVTDAEDDDAGHVIDGQVTATFGDVMDTDGRTVTFLVTVDEGQAGNDIKNIAVVESDNTDPGDPEEIVKIYPREPVLEAEKLAVNKEAGKDKIEVGDTVIYTIEGRNTVSDSLVEDFIITDELPAGLKFVEGSLEASHDGEVTFTNGVITATFGDVEDTEWRTVTFEAVIESSQSGEEIKNIATVGGGNIDKPEKPEEEIVIDVKESVKPKDPVEPSEPEQRNEGDKLPKTATNIFNYGLLGAILMLIGLVILRKRKTVEK